MDYDEYIDWYEKNAEKIPLHEPHWPEGTVGYNREKEFMEHVKSYKDIGYGRMIQMIQAWWDYLEEKRKNEFEK